MIRICPKCLKAVVHYDKEYLSTLNIKLQNEQVVLKKKVKI
ncbi:hypothetical protein [Methanococcus maripaludis]|uniref:Uncharacterized protein n=1 Tax=Methanococcus maripaludis TaxID=39152 RepID=A0A7J9S5G8_METMI|nr:hypothetical protein [Methanococcus maripaludis]MBB6067932.1 hypothetical protein [Methanococcus maripaludis]